MSNKAIGCLLVLALGGACSAGTGNVPTSQSSSRPVATSSPSISPSTAPSSVACRLPVDSPTTSSTEPPGGWITFPRGEFERDPESLPGRLSAHVPSYDRAFSRWVPVEYENVAPDGASYILHNEASLPKAIDFYLVDVKTGTRKFALSGDGPPQAQASWTIVKYAKEGVYLWSTGIATVPGLWLLDRTSGAVRLVDGSHYWGAVADGGAWAVDPPFGATADTYRIYRLDLTSGAVTTWYEGSTPIRLLSPTPDGDVLVSFGEYGSGRLELLSSPNQLVPLDVPPELPQIYGAYMTTPGVWLAFPQNGLALYQKGEGVRVMTRSVQVFSVAGDCF